MSYPLIERCFPNLKINTVHLPEVTSYLGPAGTWFPVVKASDLERELEKAKHIRLFDTGGGYHTPDMIDKSTHTALLIGIEPIKKDTAKDLLRELIGLTAGRPLWELDDIVKRAKALLERGEK